MPPAMTSSRPMTASRPASVAAVQNEELEVVSRQLAQVREENFAMRSEMQ